MPCHPPHTPAAHQAPLIPTAAGGRLTPQVVPAQPARAPLLLLPADTAHTRLTELPPTLCTMCTCLPPLCITPHVYKQHTSSPATTTAACYYTRLLQAGSRQVCTPCPAHLCTGLPARGALPATTTQPTTARPASSTSATTEAVPGRARRREGQLVRQHRVAAAAAAAT